MRTTARPEEIVPPPRLGPPICVTDIGVATWPADSSGFFSPRSKTTRSFFETGL